MAAPYFVQASTGSTDAGGAWSATGAAGTSGNFVIVQILQDGTTDGAVTFTGASHIENLAGTDNAWTDITGPNADGSWPIGSAATGRQFIKIGRLIDATAPTISGGNSTSEDLYWRFYEFSNVSTGTTLAAVIENSTAGNATNGAATSTTCSDTAVTTLGPDRLALNLVGLSDDAMGLNAFASATGGTWTMAAIYEESSGTDATIALQVGLLGSLSGGYQPGTSATLYGGSGIFEQQAQKFTTSGALTLAAIQVAVGKDGSPADNLIIEIQTDSAGRPSGTPVSGSANTIAGSSLVVGGQLIIRTLDVSCSLSAATTYHLVFRRDGARDTVNDFIILGGNLAGGESRNSGTWSNDTNLCFALQTATDKAGATIDGGSDAITSIGWGVVGFALIGTTPSSIPHDLPLPQPSNFQNPAIF